MIEVKDFGEVRQFIMGRVVDDTPIYVMACYYVDGLLIDTGPACVADEVEEAFRSYPVKVIVNTHHHEDHISNNVFFQEKLGVGPALAHPMAVPKIEDPSIWVARLRNYQYFTWGAPVASKAVAIGPEVRTPKHCFKVIETPGHCDDHICLLEQEEGWLFSGDIFIGERVPTLRSDEDALGILDSLKKLLQYPFETIFCASGKVFKNGHEVVKNKIAYLEEIKDRIETLHRQGLSLDEIRERVLGKETALYEPTEGDFAKINLVRSLLKTK